MLDKLVSFKCHSIGLHEKIIIGNKNINFRNFNEFMFE